MPLKQFTIDFRELGKEKSFRYDVDFVNFQNEFLSERFYSFNDLFSFAFKNKVNTEKLDDFFYSEIGNVSKEGDVEPVKLNFDERKEEEENYYKKIEKGDIIQVKENDILLSKVRPNLKKYVFVNQDNKNYFYTSAFVHLVPRKLNKILYYSLRTIFYENLIAISRQGKGYPTLKEDDFLCLKFDKKVIDNLSAKQDQIIAQIEPIEKNIKELKGQIIPTQEIINKVFAREFKFDLEKFEELKKEKFFEVEILKLNTSLIRSTVIQNNYKSEYLKKFLKNNTLFLKDIITKPIKRGKQPEYVEDGVKVIKTLNIQKGCINFDEVQFVSDEFLKNDEQKARIHQNDLLLTSTGMGRGKFALYNDEEICFADSHISIVRFNQEKTLPYFLNYYCQSFLGTEQLKYIEMHIKGTPEIYETQLNYFQIPNISLQDQRKIIDEIKIDLDKLENMKQKIKAERVKIEEIIKNKII